jgi:tetratricopeptide (TPR) repeat protein
MLLAIASPFLWAGYHAHVGQTDLERYHSAEARAHFNACFHVWPWSRSAPLHRLAARAARRDGDFEEADRLIHECQDTLHDDSAETVLEWAMLRAAMGDLDATAEPLRDAARREPRLIPLVLEALAEGYLTMSRILDALSTTDDWLAREPNNPQAWFVRGQIHRQVGAVQEIVVDYQHVLDVDPERTEARWWMAVALLEIGRYQEAYQHLCIVQQQRRDDGDVSVRLAMCLYRLDRQQEARELLDGVLAAHPEHGLALLTRGQIALEDGQLSEAEQWLRQAARLLPYDYKTQSKLADCLRQQDKLEEAQQQRTRAEDLYERRQQQTQILTQLMSQRPDDAALHCKLGVLCLLLGTPQVGEAWLLSALRLDPNYTPALEALAQYYRKRGETERAEAYERQAQNEKTTNHTNHTNKRQE